MRSIRKINSKKRVLVSIFLLASVCLLSYVLFRYQNENQNRLNQDSEIEQAQQETGSNIKERSVGSGDPKSSGSEQPPDPVEQENGKSIIAVTISAVNQTESQLQLRTLLGATLSSGTCLLVMTKGDTSITKEANVRSLANSSTCLGFDIPLSELTSGSWDVRLNFESETLIGSAQKIVEIK